ncbi:hypothetical protein BDR06DRAFT_79993 [Suillus hirtellus]|nr:hypothetical protein BDR06DRAFT_79993 [Suillus hirtellus]
MVTCLREPRAIVFSVSASYCLSHLEVRPPLAENINSTLQRIDLTGRVCPIHFAMILQYHGLCHRPVNPVLSVLHSSIHTPAASCPLDPVVICSLSSRCMAPKTRLMCPSNFCHNQLSGLEALTPRHNGHLGQVSVEFTGSSSWYIVHVTSS